MRTLLVAAAAAVALSGCATPLVKPDLASERQAWFSKAVRVAVPHVE